MNFMRRFLTRLFNSVTGRVHEERLNEEIAEHITLQTEENLRAGLSPRRGKTTSYAQVWRHRSNET